MILPKLCPPSTVEGKLAVSVKNNMEVKEDDEGNEETANKKDDHDEKVGECVNRWSAQKDFIKISFNTNKPRDHFPNDSC